MVLRGGAEFAAGKRMGNAGGVPSRRIDSGLAFALDWPSVPCARKTRQRARLSQRGQSEKGGKHAWRATAYWRADVREEFFFSLRVLPSLSQKSKIKNQNGTQIW